MTPGIPSKPAINELIILISMLIPNIPAIRLKIIKIKNPHKALIKNLNINLTGIDISLKNKNKSNTENKSTHIEISI